MRDEIGAVRARTAAPLNVNFFCHVPPTPDPEREAAWRAELAADYAAAGLAPSQSEGSSRTPFDAAMADVVEETRPPVVSFHFGLPEDALLERVRRTGAKIYSTATTVAEAHWLDARGVDAMIAQGAEAGGYRGMFLSDDVDAQPGLFALLPQIVDAVRAPVVAAGAVADGRGILAAFALGARAVQIGATYLRTPQATTSAAHRRALAAARDDATRSPISSAEDLRANFLHNRFMRDHGPMNPRAPAFPLASGAVAPLRAHHQALGSGDYSPLCAGQAAALAREEDAGELTARLWGEAAALAALPSSIKP